MLSQMGEEVTAFGIARRYASIAASIVIDRADMELLEPIRSLGTRAIVDDIVMDGAEGETRLASALLRAFRVVDGSIEAALEIIRANGRGVLATYRCDGHAEPSPVIAAVDVESRVVISTRAGRDEDAQPRPEPTSGVLRAQRPFRRGVAHRGRGTSRSSIFPEAMEPSVDYDRRVSASIRTGRIIARPWSATDACLDPDHVDRSG